MREIKPEEQRAEDVRELRNGVAIGLMLGTVCISVDVARRILAVLTTAQEQDTAFLSRAAADTRVLELGVYYKSDGGWEVDASTERGAVAPWEAFPTLDAALDYLRRRLDGLLTPGDPRPSTDAAPL